jgi:hypothetical protein
MLNDALKYLSYGWSVMPLRPQAKEPLLGSWTEFQRRLPTSEEVTRWFTNTPDANLAILTGTVSKLGVVDFDGPDGMETLQTLRLTSPVTSITGKGRQLFFRHPGTILKNSVRSLPGLDVRGDGGYVVAPPSIHPNGKRYQWLTPVGAGLIIPPFPTEKLHATPTSVTGEPRLVTGTANLGKPSGWISDALKGLTNGNRNDTFASVVGKLHRDRWTPDDIRSLLVPHAVRCQFPESELETVIWSITRKPVVVNGGVKPDAPKMVLRTFATDADEYKRRKSGDGILEYPTGYRRFDAATSGLKRGELLVIGARTETGKTNWLLGSAYGMCEGNKRVLLLSTEMGFDRIWDRYIPIGVRAKEHSFIVCDDFTPDIGRVKEALIESRADVFIFDHINIVGDDNETISRFLKGLKELAREFNIPGIVSAQLNRQAEWKDQDGQRIEPGLHHLKGSGTIEETAAQVLLLSEKEDNLDAKFIQGIIAKNRYGEKGVVDFVLRKKPYRMEEL